MKNKSKNSYINTYTYSAKEIKIIKKENIGKDENCKRLWRKHKRF